MPDRLEQILKTVNFLSPEYHWLVPDVDYLLRRVKAAEVLAQYALLEAERADDSPMGLRNLGVEIVRWQRIVEEG